MNAWEIFYDPCQSDLQMILMLKNALSLFSFKFVPIVHILTAFYRNVNMNASQSLQPNVL